MLKRIFDVLVSLISILLLAPVFIVVSLLIVMKDGFPVLYSQKRVGLKGKEFEMLKFRSMVKNADQVGPHFTSSTDSRITPIGRMLRKTSIDELPQLINVLLGHMSLVGPRPNVMKQFCEYLPSDWDKRNLVKPGITGIAQISGRSNCTFEERLQYDLSYVENKSFFLDIKIMLLTVFAVVNKKGTN